MVVYGNLFGGMHPYDSPVWRHWCKSLQTAVSSWETHVAPLMIQILRVLSEGTQTDVNNFIYFCFCFCLQWDGGCSIDGPVMDAFHEKGAGYQYISLRNQFGAGMQSNRFTFFLLLLPPPSSFFFLPLLPPSYY